MQQLVALPGLQKRIRANYRIDLCCRSQYYWHSKIKLFLHLLRNLSAQPGNYLFWRTEDNIPTLDIRHHIRTPSLGKYRRQLLHGQHILATNVDSP
jgi:hypothetical protein